MTKLILGIDCGLLGALTFYNKDPLSIEIFDMPTHEITTNGKKKNRIDIYELARIIDNHSADITHAFVEDVTASPQMGVTSAFSFGMSAGLVHGVLSANFIPMTLVRPQVWKKHFGLKSDKDDSRRKASSLFPNCTAQWARKKDDGRAEALLIAVYGSYTV
jgi:crossover junction endodeoxyribonuclease RuvC